MIERTSGYSNKAMWDYCETLKKVVLQTKTIKSGRGKAIDIREVLKYDTEKEVIDKIVSSCEHYKNLYDMEDMRYFQSTGSYTLQWRFVPARHLQALA